MSILIHMKMPKDGECIVVSSCGTARKYNPGDVLMYGDAYNKTADAIELPPHGRLIDADALEEKMVYNWDVGADFVIDDELYAAPTIIQADPEKEETT